MVNKWNVIQFIVSSLKGRDNIW